MGYDLLISIFVRCIYLFVFFYSANAYTVTDIDIEKLKDYLAKEEVYYKDGLYVGHLVDTSVKYPVSLISELENERSIFVAHVFNQKQFWVAKIDKHSVKNVIYQMALFDGLFGIKLTHAQLRFQLAVPATLYRVKNNKLVVTATSDLVFTVQAATPIGNNYNIFDAVAGNYVVVSRLVNTYDRVVGEEIPDGDIIRQYQLVNLSLSDKYMLLLNGIRMSNENLAKETYYATTANCINILMDIIDYTLDLSYPRLVLTFENTLLNGRSPNEKLILEALRARNLIRDDSRLEDYIQN